MIVDEKIYYFKNGEMKLLSRTRYTYNINEIEKKIKKWYRVHPYSKKINEKMFCGDYRIDQQRPQRNVYSEVYLKIVSISEMERKVLDEVVKKIERNIDYPTVWDDGENRHYEDTIHCPKCGKRRKVLTSKTHCEFCGFEFNNAKKCPICKDLSLTENQYCNHCGYDFNSKEIKKPKKKRLKVCCSECKKINRGENKYCVYCGHKLMKIPKSDKSYKKYCTYCGKQIERDEDYCHCGNKVKKRIKKEKICTVCGEWNEYNDEYCWNCGHYKYNKGYILKLLADKKCPNCKTYYIDGYNYCEECGTKLIINKRKKK